MYSVAEGSGGREGRQGRVEGSGETVKFVVLSYGLSTGGREDAACCVIVQNQTPILLAYETHAVCGGAKPLVAVTNTRCSPLW